MTAVLRIDKKEVSLTEKVKLCVHSHPCTADPSQGAVGVNVRLSLAESWRNDQTQSPFLHRRAAGGRRLPKRLDFSDKQLRRGRAAAPGTSRVYVFWNLIVLKKELVKLYCGFLNRLHSKWFKKKKKDKVSALFTSRHSVFFGIYNYLTEEGDCVLFLSNWHG